jgi:uncharacterized protein DUF6580
MSKFTASLTAFGWSRSVTLSAIVAVTLFRLIPHPPNFTPLGAMFVLGGLYLGRDLKWMAVPFAGLLISDTIINLSFDGRLINFSHFFDWAAFAVIALAARWAANRTLGYRVAMLAATPVIFFLISNFGVWASGGYPHTASGLATCYIAALPFFRGTLMGDWLFGGVLMAGIEAASRTRLTPARA